MSREETARAARPSYPPAPKVRPGTNFLVCDSEPESEGRNLGAGDRFRTDDLVLGKHTLYQLSYTRSLRPGHKRLSTDAPLVKRPLLRPTPRAAGREHIHKLNVIL